MKTTIAISDAILERARRLAAQENTTLRSSVEQGLRQVLTARTKATKLTLRDASFRGKGLQPQVPSADWERLREMAYEGHGG